MLTLRNLAFVAALVLASAWSATASGSVLALASTGFACGAATPRAGGGDPAGAPARASTAPEPQFPDGGGDLSVFAAASLTDAFTRIGGDLEAAHPGLEITFNFAGSQTLLTQLREGAPADVFAPASEDLMAAASESGLVAAAPRVFARNHLAVVVPAANPAGIVEAADLVEEGVKLVLALPEVPAGKYAREAVCRMGDAAFVDAVAGNVVSEEEDVRDVLAKVQLGEADAGIVYRTDALAAGDAVTALPLPEGADSEAFYPAAAVAGGDEALAEAFIGYLLGPQGQAALADFGFEPAGA